MPLSLDSALGIHPQAMVLRGRRAAVLAANLANADTPGYKARDLDFAAILGSRVNTTGAASPLLKVTHPLHLASAAAGAAAADQLLYRVPTQPSVDGNTVDTQTEKAEYAENALRYMASLTFLNGRFRGLIGALRGE